jgi:nucleoside-diphosphate-sugar epimerase
MARILIVGCGCRGLALADGLAAAGHPVRGTTRDPARAPELEAAGVEPAVGDPYRLATLLPHIANTSAMVWLMGSATGDDVEALHRTRLQTVLERLVDSPVRGMVYEAAGTVPPAFLREGAAAVRKASLTWQMPNVIVERHPREHEAWVAAMVAAVEQVLETET